MACNHCNIVGMCDFFGTGEIKPYDENGICLREGDKTKECDEYY